MRSLTFQLSLIALVTLFGCGRADGVRSKGVLPLAPNLNFATADQIAQREVVPGSYLVAFKDDAGTTRVAQSILQLQQGLQSMLQNTSSVNFHRTIARLNLTYPGRSFANDTNLDAHPFLNSSLTLADQYTHLTEVRFADEATAEAQLKEWYAAGQIVFAEPNYQRSLAADEIADTITKNFRDNPTTPWIDQVNLVGAMEKISANGGSKNTPLVAVMDSGVDVRHTNLADAIFVNDAGENKQCKNDIYGCNTTVAEKDNLGDGNVFPTGTSDFNQTCPISLGQCEHGTHVSGLIAARNSTDFTGMCPYCKILVVKVVEVDDSNGSESFPIKDSSILAGLAYVSGFKSGGEPLVRVINASFGKFESSRSVELFIKALKTFGRGTLLVAAAGNEDTMKRQFPAGFDDVLAVANVQSDTDHPYKSPSSNFGMWVDIAAPGDGNCATGTGILSTVPGGGAECRTGTSMASPVVAGIAGLVLSQEPNLTANELEQRLIETSDPTRLYLDGNNNAYRPNIKGAGLVPLLGAGVVNAAVAIDPSTDKTPLLSADRPDAVRAGCGVIGGKSLGFAPWLILMLPMVVLGFRRYS